MSFRISSIDSINNAPSTPVSYVLNTRRVSRVNSIGGGIHNLSYIKHIKTNRGNLILQTQDTYYGMSVNDISNESARLTIPITKIGNTLVTDSYTFRVDDMIWAENSRGATTLTIETPTNRIEQIQTTMTLSDLEIALNTATGSLLLDLYPGAISAQALIQLVSSYSGPGVSIRRDSDNALQDFPFVNGKLDRVAILAFTGAGSGFINTRYDQLGLNHLNSLASASQPRIVNSGVFDTMDNGALAEKYDGVDDILQTSAYSPLFVNPNIGYYVWEPVAGTNNQAIGLTNAGASSPNARLNGTDTDMYQNGASFSEAAPIVIDKPIIQTMRSATTDGSGKDYIHRINGAEIVKGGTLDIGTDIATALTVGARGNNSSWTEMRCAVCVNYRQDNIPDAPKIELLLNSYYNAY